MSMSPVRPSSPCPCPCRRPRASSRGPRRRSLVLGTALSLLAPLAAGPPPAAATMPAATTVTAATADVTVMDAASSATLSAADPRNPAPRPLYGWPTGAPADVLQGFDPPAVVWGPGHRGVDLALPAGSPVLAAGDGTVAFAGVVAGRPVVSIDHADGVRTTYEPVEASVATGDVVARGQTIGTLRAGHRSDGADALHWGARTGPKTYINPLRLLRPAVIRLKPLRAV